MAIIVLSKDSRNPRRHVRNLSLDSLRLSNIGRKGTRAVDHTLTLFGRSSKMQGVMDNNKVTRNRSRASRPLSRSSRMSIASYGNLLAWNRISTWSNEDSDKNDVLAPKRLTLHEPDEDWPLPSLSFDLDSEPGAYHRIQELDMDLPDAAAFEIAAKTYKYLPYDKTYPAPTQKIWQYENWDSFLGRILDGYPDLCLSPEGISPSASIVELDGLQDSGSNPISLNIDYDIQNAKVEAVQFARFIKGATLVWLHRRGSKLVSEPAPTNLDFLTFTSARDSMFDKPVRPLSFASSRSSPDLNDVDRKVIKRNRFGLKHDSLPYIAWGEPFDPLNEFGVKSVPASVSPKNTTIVEELNPNYTSWLDLSDDTEDEASPPSSPYEMPIKPKLLSAAPHATSKRSHRPSARMHGSPARQMVARKPIRHRSVRFQQPSVKQTRPAVSLAAQRPHMLRSRSTGVMTRRLTGARNSVPQRLVMIDHYPLFVKGEKKLTKTKHVRAVSAPAVSGVTAAVKSATTFAPTPTNTPTRSTLTLTRDRTSGVLTRNITNAAKTVPGRVVMVDHYPFFQPEKKSISTPTATATATATSATTAPIGSSAPLSPLRSSLPHPSPLRHSFLASELGSPSPSTKHTTTETRPSIDTVMESSMPTINHEALDALEGKIESYAMNLEALAALEGKSHVRARGLSEGRQARLWSEIEGLCRGLGI